MKSVVFTVCNLKYLPKALVLARSVYETSKLTTSILIFDKEQELDLNEDYIDIAWIENVADDDFKFLAFKYNVIELSTAFKPFYAKKLLENYDKVIFLDPDIKVYSNLEIIEENLEKECFLLTPHLINVSPNFQENLSLQKFGFFNLGFFALKRSEKAKKVLDWWWEQNRHYCFIETHTGAFDDQAWMSLAPHYFPFIKSLKHPGMNVGWWNLHERKIHIEIPQIKVNDYPLIFFHFSNYGDKNNLTAKIVPIGTNSQKNLLWLAKDYSEELLKNNLKLKTSRYSYNYFNDGSFINPLLRRAYASNSKYFETFGDPFMKPIAFKKFIKNNYLKSRGESDYSGISYNQKEKYSHIIKLYTLVTRFVLFIVGPNRFIALNRLMTYSTSLINYKELWKIKKLPDER